MTSLDKMLEIMNYFDEDNLSIDVSRAAELTGTSRATAYRYIQSLSKSGLLMPAAGGNYVLGSRIIELEMVIRESDPLLKAAGRLIRRNAEDLGLNIMLCSYYGDKVLCADFAWPDRSIGEIYKRGRAMPIFRGAMAKVILAHLSPSQLKNVYRWNEDQIRESGLAMNWDEFRKAMNAMRSDGYAVTYSEVFDDLVGIAAPVRDTEKRILGSVVFVLAQARFNRFDSSELITEIRRISAEIEEGIARLTRSHDDTSVYAVRLKRPAATEA
ncbi:helix-turn-helix domain-containing protein [Microvirga sp. ACRRW]|uniref:IclR family transcriptional regulator n=1 Tax=Microvirga sp. ACRRW TaxID=2918205 RepID=UPI001EF3FA98|nr:IclR family transcriptional regulator C-terminal domain-containing protein [Microvirga sp. ACRRW]MCG7393235.1 helix-turn-helix domain-containing protein [Microvirga sp. ACRRW]